MQELSQTEFSQYIADRITSPLNISASFNVPSKEDQVNLATGYILSEEEKLEPLKEWWTMPPLPGPEGSLKGTADDMTRWLQFHLANGTLNDVSLLHPDLIRSMHSQHFTMDPSLAGYAFAFSEYFRNKVRGIMIEVSHEFRSHRKGSSHGFSSLFFLLPEEEWGFFWVCNRQLETGPAPLMGTSEAALFRSLTALLIDRYFPLGFVPPDPRPWETLSLERMKRFAGKYVPSRYPHHSFAKLMRIWTAIEVKVWEENGKNGLRVGDFQYVEVSPMQFQERKDVHWLRPQIAFRENDNGDLVYMLFEQIALERIQWYEDKTFLIGSLIFFATVFAIYPIVGLAHLIYWWKKKREIFNIQFYRRLDFGEEAGFWSARGIALSGRIVGITACVLDWIFGLGMFHYLIFSDLWLYEVTIWAKFLLVLPTIATALSAVLVIYCALFILQSQRFSVYVTGVEIIFFILLTLSLGVFTIFLAHWNFLGIHD